MTSSEATITQGRSIEDRVRDAGLPVLSVDQINSKKIRRSMYTPEADANFPLYGEDDAVVMSYDTQLDEGVKEAMRKQAVDSIQNRAMEGDISFKDI